jgi:beta-glucuronidase
MIRVDDLQNVAVRIIGPIIGLCAAVCAAFARRLALAGVLGAAALGLLLAAPVAGATRTDLDRDWQFRADPHGTGEASGWNYSIPGGTESIAVPHTWNVGTLHDYRGVGWYFLSFAPPSHSPDTHTELHFGATFYSARVWLNGVEVGAHEGGFTAYSFDITPYLRPANLLAVRIDNRPGIATIPGIAARGGPEARYDWWTYGGLVRDVWLTTSGSAWVRRQQIRTEQNTGGAVIHDQIFLESSVAERRPATVRVTALGPDNRVAASDTRAISLARGALDVAVSLNLARPELWGIDHPKLYRMVVELLGRDNVLLDEDSASFGIRKFEIRDRHLLINGERVRLTGITRHEDSPWEGLAETPGTMRYDYDDMRMSLHTTLSRPVHYPQNPFILDYADRHGILLIPEIPVWQFSEAQLSDPRVVELARQQMREMIQQAGNHPSVFGWSVANESATATPGGIAYFRTMRALIRQIDPGRPVSFADDALSKLDRADQSAANDADFLMMNQYFGSWHGPASALVPALDKIDRLFPGKMLIVSEMGFAGIFAGGAVAADQARIRIMREQMPVLAARDWIAGAILWCYQDYKSPRNLWPGETEGYVEHGLVDEWRQRKPSYSVWKELNTPAKIAVRWTGPGARAPTGFVLLVSPNTDRDLPFYTLRDYRLVWAVVDEKGATLTRGDRQLVELIAPVSVTGTLPSVSLAPGLPSGRDATVVPDGLQGPDNSHGKGQMYRLSVTLLSPTGMMAADARLEWRSEHPTIEQQ